MLANMLPTVLVRSTSSSPVFFFTAGTVLTDRISDSALSMYHGPRGGVWRGRSKVARVGR